MARHAWVYEPEWMKTEAGKHVGGFSRCRHCSLMRFSRPGFPPQSYYVPRAILVALKDTRDIDPASPLVVARAGECGAQLPMLFRRSA